MSLIHWDKSVLSFHLREIAEDANDSHPVALLGLGTIAIASLLLPVVTKLGRPFIKQAIKNSLSLNEESTASTVNISTNISTSELTQIWEQAAIASQNNIAKTIPRN